MKQGNFAAKLLSLMLMLGVLAYYQSVAQARAALVSENEAAVAAAQEHNADILRQQAALLEGIEEEPELYTPGEYEGSGTGFGGTITVCVSVSGSEIEKIEVLSHDGEDPAYYDLAKTVVDDVLKQQSVEVDTVSGATFSSGGLLEAIGDALGKAVK